MDATTIYQTLIDSLIQDNQNNVTDYGSGYYYFYDFDYDGCMEMLVQRTTSDLAYADIEIYAYNQSAGNIQKIYEHTANQGGINGFVENGYVIWEMGGAYSGCTTYVYTNGTFKQEQSYYFSSMDPDYEQLKAERDSYLSQYVFSVASYSLF